MKLFLLGDKVWKKVIVIVWLDERLYNIEMLDGGVNRRIRCYFNKILERAESVFSDDSKSAEKGVNLLELVIILLIFEVK